MNKKCQKESNQLNEKDFFEDLNPLNSQDIDLENSLSEPYKIRYQKKINLFKAMQMISTSKKSPVGLNMSEEDKKFISKNLNELKFFQDLQLKGRLKQFTENCIDHLNVEIFSVGNILLHKGDTTEKIHILVKGDILIYEPKTPQELLKDQIMFKKTKKRDISTQDQLFFKNNMRKLDYISQGVLNVKNVLKLRVGDYFGDTRCPEGQKVEQNQTYLANKNIIVLTLYKDIFNNLVSININEKRRNKLQFFKQLLPTSPLIPLVYFLGYIREAYFKYKEIIYSENEEQSNFLYIIYDGEVIIQIQPSEDLKKQYKSKIELAILGKFEVFGDESITNEPRKTDALSHTKEGVQVYYLKSKDLQKQTELNMHILKLLERNSRLKTDFQSTQLLHIKQINQRIEKQNTLVSQRKDSLTDQLIANFTKNFTKLEYNNTQSDQMTIEQAYDIKPDIDFENTQSSYFQDFRAKTVSSYSIKQTHKTQDTETSSFQLTQSSQNNEKFEGLNNSDGFQFMRNKEILYSDGNINYLDLSIMSEQNSPKILRKNLNSDTLLSTSLYSSTTLSQQNKQNSQKLYLNNMRRMQSRSVFISYDLNESIFDNGNDNDILNNITQIEKLNNVKVQNYSKLCFSQRNTNTQEKKIHFKAQLEQRKNKQMKSQKTSIENLMTPFSRCGSPKSQTLPQIPQHQINKVNDCSIIKNQIKYSFMDHQMNINDQIRTEEQSKLLSKNISDQSNRWNNQSNQTRSYYNNQSFSPEKSSKGNQQHHQFNSMNNIDPPNIQTNTFKQKYDKNFSKIKNIHFTKKNLNGMKKLIFSVQQQDIKKQKTNELQQFGQQSYDLNSNDLPILNLYKIQHKQSVKNNYETKVKSSPLRKIENKQLINGIISDKEKQYNYAFHVDSNLP